MLAVPAKMITDHFEAPATPLLTFWVRGQSVSLLGATRASTGVAACGARERAHVWEHVRVSDYCERCARMH